MPKKSPFVSEMGVFKPEEAESVPAEEPKKVKVEKAVLTDEESHALEVFKVQGSLSQQQAIEYHNLLKKVGE